MAEFLVVVRSNHLTRTRSQEVDSYGRGDVITVQDDGWDWSPRELTNPNWRIIKAVGMTVSEGEGLISTEKNPTNLKLRIWKRWRKLDLSNILIGPGKFKNFLDDDTRVNPIFTFNNQQRVLITNVTEIKENADIYVTR